MMNTKIVVVLVIVQYCSSTSLGDGVLFLSGADYVADEGKRVHHDSIHQQDVQFFLSSTTSITSSASSSSSTSNTPGLQCSSTSLEIDGTEQTLNSILVPISESAIHPSNIHHLISEQDGDDDPFSSSSIVVPSPPTLHYPTSSNDNAGNEKKMDPISQGKDEETVRKEDLIDVGYGVPQEVMGIQEEMTRRVLSDMKQYMRIVVYDPSFVYYHNRELCQNTNKLCAYWGAIGECESNSDYMTMGCAPICKSCDYMLMRHHTTELTKDEILSVVSVTPNNENVVLVDVGYGVPQQMGTDNHDDILKKEIQFIFDETKRYMENVVYADNYPYKDIRTECQNRDQRCSLWSAQGECEKNKSYMKVSCAPACQSCDQIIYENRCPTTTIMKQNNDNSNNSDVWKSHQNNLNEMFERIVHNPQYNSTILSYPRALSNPNRKKPLSLFWKTICKRLTGDYWYDEDHQEAPWIVQIDNFLSPTECQKLIEYGHTIGYERSKDIGIKQYDGTYGSNISNRRTSNQAWCNDMICSTDIIGQQILSKLEQLTNIPNTHMEHLQLLRYEEKQYYQRHHDYIDYEIDRIQGVRILTVFFYLNNVSKGGETYFPLLNVTIQPSQGRAVLWPSVYHHNPNEKDPRTEHEALPVLDGIKYAANAWYHQRNFKLAYDQNCI